MNRISRRKALRNLAGVTTAATLPWMGFLQSRSLALVIQNGSVFTNGRLQPLSVGITREGTIVTSAGRLEGDEVIDARDHIVSPGFIDILADNGSDQLRTFRTFEKYKITDGLTTVLQLHGGAPSPGGYHRSMDTHPHLVNYGVGVFVMMIRNQYTSLPDRLRKVEQGLEEGGLAVCHSIEYQPTDYAEVLAYARLAKKFNRPMFLHLRYSSKEQELEGVKEAVRLAEESQAHIHIDHLHSTGGTYQMEQALSLIRQARQRGCSITCCVYPYSYWATYLISKRFDPGWQQRFQLQYEDLTIVGTGEKITAQSFGRYRQQPGLLVATPEGTMPMEKTVRLALQEEFCLIGSDGGILKETRANNHPRGAGCFATALRYGIESGLGLERLLEKITAGAARLVSPALQTRGQIATGAVADITIFNPARIRGGATVANPNQYSEGISHVIVNGQVALRPETREIGAFGRPIRY